MICLPPQGTPHTHTRQPTWPTAHTAHSQHCGHTALPPGQKTNPRIRADPTQTVYDLSTISSIPPHTLEQSSSRKTQFVYNMPKHCPLYYWRSEEGLHA